MPWPPSGTSTRRRVKGNHPLNAEDGLGIPTDVTVQGVAANGNPTQEVRRGFNIVVNRTGNGLPFLVQLLPKRHPRQDRQYRPKL